MKRLFLFTLILLNSCSYTNKEFTPKVVDIKDYNISATVNQKSLKVCELKLVVTNINSKSDELYVEVTAYDRKNRIIGLFNYVIDNVKKGNKITRVSKFEKTGFCNIIKKLEIYGG